ncbi:MAG: hypothetical protein K1060chlam2_01280 [Chlamydiae bacterium]|nr:hypothetical protein [Chlamydiota bacterium]
MTNEDKKLNATQVGLHSVRNILGTHQQVDLFSEHSKDFCDEFGIKSENTIDRFGVDLTDTQSRVMEGILHGFSRTAYKGNTTPTSKEQVATQKFSGKLPASYKYIQEIPKLRVTQSELLVWSGINKNSIAAWSRAIEAIQVLGQKQYCFYYDRLALDETGTPIRDEKKNWKKEEVVSVDTLFTIKEIRDKSSGTLKYYEIMPSAIFLDQRESYFMFIPLNWREEVKQLTGKKKSSSYTFRFLLFLRYQYELKRRSKKLSPPYRIRWSPEEIAIAIKMPRSVYLRKKKKARELLDNAYSVAKLLGYLSDYKRTGSVDILTLNDKKYSNTRTLSSSPTEILEENIDHLFESATSLFVLFYECRMKLDAQCQVPRGESRQEQILGFQNLLKHRHSKDIEMVISWSISKKYWCSRLSTPFKLVQNFSEAWSEMMLGSEQGKELMSTQNRELAQNIIQQIKNKGPETRINLLNQYVEITVGVTQPVCISYDLANFEDSLKKALIKCRIEI